MRDILMYVLFTRKISTSIEFDIFVNPLKCSFAFDSIFALRCRFVA